MEWPQLGTIFDYDMAAIGREADRRTIWNTDEVIERLNLSLRLLVILIAVPAGDPDSAVLRRTNIEHRIFRIMEDVSYAYHRQCNRGSFCRSYRKHILAHLGIAP